MCLGCSKRASRFRLAQKVLGSKLQRGFKRNYESMADIVTIRSFSGDGWRPIDELRVELTAKWLCVELYALLTPKLLGHQPVKEAIVEGLTFVDGASDEALAAAAPELMLSLDVLLARSKALGRPKVSWKKLGDDFQWLCRDRKDLTQRGIPVAWIAERFHLPAFGIDEHVSWHGRVGIGHHAGYTSLDEMHLLSDMFYLLALARQTQALVDKARDDDDNVCRKLDWYNVVTGVKSNVCALARQALLTSCGFVEAFINGLGSDFEARNPNLREKEREFLLGRQRGRWVSLDRRLEGFPQIIRGVSEPLFGVCDRARRDEPFKTFFEIAVDLRDGAMHPGKGKTTIWLGPDEWVDLATKAVGSALEISRTLWSSCKVGAPLPKLLWELDHAKLSEQAQRRIDANKQLEGMLDQACTVNDP